MKALEDYVTTVPDFPKKGIMFRDVTSILNDRDGFRLVIDELVERLKDVDFDVVVGSESRGFIFGAPVAYVLNKAFVLIRKKGKLPREKYSEDYELEYGTATVEMHEDAISSGQKVVVIDDLIATGGTAKAAIKLVERGGGKVVKVGFVMELAGLKGRDKLRGYDVFSLITYPGA
ncbi:MAG: adenine phosphoribosyltransferase [archaeon]|nr:adenine phosphoribosyltransferase [archaeon]